MKEGLLSLTLNTNTNAKANTNTNTRSLGNDLADQYRQTNTHANKIETEGTYRGLVKPKTRVSKLSINTLVAAGGKG